MNQQLLDNLTTAAHAVAKEYVNDLGKVSVKQGLPHDHDGLHKVLSNAVYAGALDAVLRQVRGNQSKCAVVFDLNRATMRTRMKEQGRL